MPKVKAKQKSVKTQEERIQVKDGIVDKLALLNIDMDVFDSLKPFARILEEYTQPTLLSGFTGSINIPEIGRRLEYNLPMRVWTPPMVKLVVM